MSIAQRVAANLADLADEPELDELDDEPIAAAVALDALGEAERALFIDHIARLSQECEALRGGPAEVDNRIIGRCDRMTREIATLKSSLAQARAACATLNRRVAAQAGELVRARMKPAGAEIAPQSVRRKDRSQARALALELLRQSGEATVDAIATGLNLQVGTARMILYRLQDDGLLLWRNDPSSPMGRKLYRLAEGSNRA